MKELVFAGFGGQGILTAGVIVSQIVLYKGWKATWLPSYGPSMRGGTANCTVKYDEHYIYTPGMEEPDLLLAMNTPSFKKFQGTIKPGGFLLANSDLVDLDGVREDIHVLKVPCLTITEQVGNPKGANIVMVGAIAKAMGDFTLQEAIDGMNDMFRKKGKEKFEALNTAALKAGYNFLS